MDDNIYYGFLSLLPALIAIILSICTKNIIVSLLIAVYVGALIINNFNPFTGLISMISDFMYVKIAEESNAQTIFMMSIIGGFVALLTSTGAANSFAKNMTHKLDSRSKGEFLTWIGGIVIWFTDTGNSLILGPIFEEILDKLKTSKEKFAYILDVTSICDAALIPIIGWGVYSMGLIDTELKNLSINSISSWTVYVGAIPFNFYAIISLVLAGFLAFSQFDFGPMLKAQHRAAVKGETMREGGTPMRKPIKEHFNKDVDVSVWIMIIPLIVMVITIFTNLILNGFPRDVVPGKMIRSSIAAGFLLASLTLILLSMKDKIMTFNECMSIFLKGVSNSSFMAVLLTLAWSLGGVSTQMGTAEYILRITEGFLSPEVLPGIFFLIGCIMSFATGSSWGTMAILMPLAIPMAYKLDVSLSVVVAAVSSGGLFGDSSSPISDTTMLASTGAGGDHMDFFTCMLPYSLTVGVISFVTFIIAGHMASNLIIFASLVFVLVLAYLLHKFFMKKYGFDKF
ncbi:MULTISPECIES: Na+/H+ antiporter NhaC family protein [Anaerococcus]|nr:MULTISPECIES: Na+/H+ antiporter NhaC family protein [Anaerococcus]MDY3006485.1 Na+/H+ antiporter NhaC family protein [Anaerococcus porci]